MTSEVKVKCHLHAHSIRMVWESAIEFGYFSFHILFFIHLFLFPVTRCIYEYITKHWRIHSHAATGRVRLHKSLLTVWVACGDIESVRNWNSNGRTTLFRFTYYWRLQKQSAAATNLMERDWGTHFIIKRDISENWKPISLHRMTKLKMKQQNCKTAFMEWNLVDGARIRNKLCCFCSQSELSKHGFVKLFEYYHFTHMYYGIERLRSILSHRFCLNECKLGLASRTIRARNFYLRICSLFPGKRMRLNAATYQFYFSLKSEKQMESKRRICDRDVCILC